MRRILLVTIEVLTVLGLAATPALAGTTTLNFETPVVPGAKSPTAGPAITTQYKSQGVVFVTPPSAPVTSPAGFSGLVGVPDLYRDTANAHSGKQVLYAFVCGGEACSFGDGYGDMLAQLETPTNTVGLYAGTRSGGQVELAGYNTAGVEVAHQIVTAGTQVATHLQVTSSSSNIAYFSVARIGYGWLEIDDLSFETPSVMPPPAITISAPGGASAYPGGTTTLPVYVQRFNGASDAVDLSVKGLPTGVGMTGGATIPATRNSITLKFSVLKNAPHVTNHVFRMSATSADVSSPSPTLKDTFSVVNPGAAIAVEVQAPGSSIPVSSATVPIAPCAVSDTTVLVSTNPTVTRSAELKLTTSGDASGFSFKLSKTSIPPTHGGFAFLTLIVQRTSNAGSGVAKVTITGTTGSSRPSSATVVIERTGLTAQGLYVTQGPQNDTETLVPSGTGASGGSYSGVVLVAGKKTVVRLYGDAAGTPTGQQNVVAELYGSSRGKPLPGSPLRPDYGTLDSKNNPTTTLPEVKGTTKERVSDAELESNANAYTFTVPYSWVAGGLEGGYWPTATTTKLVGKLQPYQSTGESASCATSESFTLNNVPFTEVGFNYSNPMVFPVAMTIKGAASLPSPFQVFQDAGAVTPLPDNGLIVYPYEASVDITDIATGQPYPCNLTNQKTIAVYSTDPLNSSTAESAANACSDIKDKQGFDRLQQFVQNYDDGAIDVSHDVGVNEGVSRGLTDGVPGQYSVVDGTPAYRPLTSVSHELFHQFGLQHAGNPACGGNGVSWPPDQKGYLDGIGVDVTAEPYKFIAAGSPDFALPNRAQAYDLMSYCAHAGGNDPNTWVSPRNWANLIGIFGTGAAADIASAARSHPPLANPLTPLAQLDSSMLRVTGFVTPSGTTIATVGPQVGPASPTGSSVDAFTLRARGSGGQLLATVPMAATSNGHVDGAAQIPISQITGEVPAAGVQSIEILDNGTLVASRVRPAIAPSVQVLAPTSDAIVGRGASVLVRWASTDPEGLPLTAVLDYSRDGGATWRTVYVGPDTGQAVIQSFFLTAARDARLRVRINDGFNESSALSGRFLALGAPPKVTILSPVGRVARIPADAQLQLSGQAISQAAQLLRGRNLRWFDGPAEIGAGTHISAGPLPLGFNRIRLIARDAAGRVGVAALTVFVTPIDLPFLTLRVPPFVGPGAKTLTIDAGASIPAELTVNRINFQLGNTRPISLPIRRGPQPIVLHMKVTANGITTPFVVVVRR